MNSDGNANWEISQDGSRVRMVMIVDGRASSWCEFPPELGYELAQKITLKCIQCEEAGKANGV